MKTCVMCIVTEVAEAPRYMIQAGTERKVTCSYRQESRCCMLEGVAWIPARNLGSL